MCKFCVPVHFFLAQTLIHGRLEDDHIGYAAWLRAGIEYARVEHAEKICIYQHMWLRLFPSPSKHSGRQLLRKGYVLHARSGHIHEQPGSIHTQSGPIHAQSGPIHAQSGSIQEQSRPVLAQPGPFTFQTDLLATWTDPFVIWTDPLAT
jgi:hypothetical protein